MLLKRIRNLREDNDLKQIDLAKLLQQSSAAYITLDSLIRLARFYNVSTDYLLELTDIKNSKKKAKQNV